MTDYIAEILRVTDLPADKRSDVDYLRSVVMLARGYAKALTLPKLELPEPPEDES